ncbi:2OG-Fe dioxygenase family protein [Pseudoalteromonas fuliginea]|uniref:2OG-Fe dioxygenase family protein n=1 Tax=Pseudoalteromonas fuliginea TaxID=1872678 RepID=UPI00317BB839
MNGITAYNSIVTKLSEQLNQKKYVLATARSVNKVLNIDSNDVALFKECWNELKRDTYMADGGKYRYRRYGELAKESNSEGFAILPHAPYTQPSYINSLNGDIERHFYPLTDEFTSSPVLTKVLSLLSSVYDSAEGKKQDWSIRLHPYRIKTTEAELGHPAPEGLHRDGVTYIASMMVCKNNIIGGSTLLTNNYKEALTSVTLNETLDIIMADDEKTMHQVSPIKPATRYKEAYRDVLVIAFTRKEKSNGLNS